MSNVIQRATIELTINYPVDEYANAIERERALCRTLRLMDKEKNVTFGVPMMPEDVELEDYNE